MRLAIVGRTSILASAARHLMDQGHSIGFVMTTGADPSVLEFQRIATEAGADYIFGTKINSAETRSRLQSAQCDLAISVNWITIVGAETLACTTHGFLNAHAGDLPRYRGNACPNWAILQNEERIGLCVHQMVTELDAGPVYVREFLDLKPDSYIADVYDWISAKIPAMFAKAIAIIESGEPPTPQRIDIPSLRTYPRRPEDARIQWQDNAEDIHRLIRASSRPFDGAFCFLEDGQVVTIWRAEITIPTCGHLAVPGQPCDPIGFDPMIACGSGFLRLTEVSIGKLSNEDSKRQINKSLRQRLV